MARIRLGPVNLDIYSIETILQTLEGFIATRSPSQIVTLNSLMFNLALRDAPFANAVSSATLIIPDSSGIKWAAGFLTGSRTEKVAGIDLLELLCQTAAERGYGVFFLGAKPDVAQGAAGKLSAKFVGLKVLGTHHGYFTKVNDGDIIALIREKAPDILFVGLDMPRQELWISGNLAKLNVPVVMGVGGSFDVISGRLRRAPEFLRRLHLEWFFRLFQQPWRITRMIDLPLFVFNVIRLGKRAASSI